MVMVYSIYIIMTHIIDEGVNLSELLNHTLHNIHTSEHYDSVQKV